MACADVQLFAAGADTLSEVGRPYESHFINLEKDEHATPEYQRIHPNGLVPAIVEDGRLFIESVDTIRHIAGEGSPLSDVAAKELLGMADAAQLDLKLLTFEFLFRGGPPPPPDAVEAFRNGHQNAWLQQFRVDFANGFDPDRINDAIARTDAGFEHLDVVLSDGRAFLEGAAFTLSDIAWMPNVHRFRLMDWPFARTPHLAAWFKRVSSRPSYREALLDWQPNPAIESFEAYTKKRQADGTDVRSFPHFNAQGGTTS